jgi:hypothetical protein
MGLKFNVDKYANNNADNRIKATAVSRSTPQHTERRRKKKSIILKKNKKLTLVNRKFLRLITDK